MTTVTEIKKAIKSLPKKDYKAFSSWFDSFEEEQWDNQIKQDQKSGSLCNLVEKARADFKAGKCKRI